MTKLEKAREIIKTFYKYAECGIFNTRNIVGDRMENLYDDGELVIDICRGWAYFEVFGLNGDEFHELKEFYGELKEFYRGLGECDG